MADSRALSIIVPTFREALNIQPLTERIFAATSSAGIDAELIIVDDNSKDGSEELVQRLSETYPIRIIVRTTERGLSSAVIAGFKQARHGFLLSMDADLQHPPEAIPEVSAPLLTDQADFVVGSRYVDKGSIVGSWSLLRKLNSDIAIWMARPLTRLRDPMSGFFGLRRDLFEQAVDLNPIGYKIALELLVKTRCQRVAEVPIEFGQRQAGESKLSLSEQMRYIRHLMRLYRFRLFNRTASPNTNGRSAASSLDGSRVPSQQ